MMSAGSRPRTSQPRGVCIYYTTPRGCFAANNCKFLHGDAAELTPYDSSKLCRYFISGFCKHGDRCWFRHERPRTSPITPDTNGLDDDDECCSICLEKPSVYGLLTGCSHVFCLTCLKSWRDPQHAGSDVAVSGVHKLCPMCRNVSRFVIPSSIFYKSSDPMKVVVVERYKESMKKVRCRYFEASPPNKRFCPFGKDCFYKHQDENGQNYVFEKGVEDCMRAFKRNVHGNSGHWARPLAPEERTEWPEETFNGSSVPSDNSVVSLVQSLLREVSVLAASERAETPGVAAQLGVLVNRILDLRPGEPGLDDDEDDRQSEPAVSRLSPQSPRARDQPSAFAPAFSSRPTSHSIIAGPVLLPEDSASAHGDDVSLDDAQPRAQVYTSLVVGSPRLQGGSNIDHEVVRACWEDESDDEPSHQSPTLVPLPDSPALSNVSKRRQSYSMGHNRQSSSIYSQLALSPTTNRLMINTDIANEEDSERTEIIRSSILVSSPPPASASTSTTHGVQAEVYCNEDHEMEDLVRSIHRTLLNQPGD